MPVGEIVRRGAMGALGSILPLLIWTTGATNEDLGRSLRNLFSLTDMVPLAKALALVFLGAVAPFFFDELRSARQILLAGACAPALFAGAIQNNLSRNLDENRAPAYSSGVGIMSPIIAAAHAQPSAVLSARCIPVLSFGQRLVRSFNAPASGQGSDRVFLFSDPAKQISQEQFLETSKILFGQITTEVRQISSETNSSIFFIEPSRNTAAVAAPATLGRSSWLVPGVAVRILVVMFEVRAMDVSSYAEDNVIMVVTETHLESFLTKFKIPQC